jgi:NADH-quinone oxidoreductase subunit H
MHFGWKVLIPINLVWILAVTSIHVLRDRNWPAWKATSVPLAVVLLLVVVPALMVIEGASARRSARNSAADDEDARLVPTFPVPPMDLVVPAGPRPLATASVRPAPPELPEGDNADG